MVTVLPSLPAQSFTEIERLAEALKGQVSEMQIDIVDGQFVPLTSWPFAVDTEEPNIELNKLKALTADFDLELDCMVVEPEQYLETLLQLPAKRIIIHYGSTELYESITDQVHSADAKLGLAFTNDISLDQIKRLLPIFDYVQVMGIAAVGQQGQPFDQRTVSTIKELRRNYPDLEIAVDGAVNQETIVALAEAGANRLAPGSAIAKQADPLAAYQELAALVAT